MNAAADYSLNETASRAKLAAKGVGYSWGMSEEVARAVFWLVSRSLPGPAMLLELLSSYAKADSVSLATPTIEHNQFKATDGWLCPVASGCALSDTCGSVDDAMRITMLNVKCPILLLPFIADIAQRTGSVLVLEFESSRIFTDGTHVRFPDSDVVSIDQTTSIVCRPADKTEIVFNTADVLDAGGRVTVDERVWEALGAFAHQTYAPSTEQSRALGAGAGLNDND